MELEEHRTPSTRKQSSLPRIPEGQGSLQRTVPQHRRLFVEHLTSDPDDTPHSISSGVPQPPMPLVPWKYSSSQPQDRRLLVEHFTSASDDPPHPSPSQAPRIPEGQEAFQSPARENCAGIAGSNTPHPKRTTVRSLVSSRIQVPSMQQDIALARGPAGESRHFVRAYEKAMMNNSCLQNHVECTRKSERIPAIPMQAPEVEKLAR
jgi:hypothetical protein